MRWLIHLYPGAWRKRYGEEFAAVLASQRASPGLVLDVIGGAVDARLHPQIYKSSSNQNENEGETMTNQMMKRCAAGGPRLSPTDQKIARTTMLASTLALTMLYLVLTKIYRSAPPVQALGYAIFPATWFVYEQTAYLHKRRRFTQVVIGFAGVAGMYLVMLAACEIAVRL
jgi:hypothetical protein